MQAGDGSKISSDTRIVRSHRPLLYRDMPAVRGDSQRIFPLCQYLPSPFDAGTRRYQVSPEEAGNIKMNQRHGVLKPYLDSLTKALIKRMKRGMKGRK